MRMLASWRPKGELAEKIRALRDGEMEGDDANWHRGTHTHVCTKGFSPDDVDDLRDELRKTGLIVTKCNTFKWMNVKTFDPSDPEHQSIRAAHPLKN